MRRKKRTGDHNTKSQICPAKKTVRVMASTTTLTGSSFIFAPFLVPASFLVVFDSIAEATTYKPTYLGWHKTVLT
jgi:hypothetical protein